VDRGPRPKSRASVELLEVNCPSWTESDFDRRGHSARKRYGHFNGRFGPNTLVLLIAGMTVLAFKLLRRP
jgi:hypothetical protein